MKREREGKGVERQVDGQRARCWKKNRKVRREKRLEESVGVRRKTERERE